MYSITELLIILLKEFEITEGTYKLYNEYGISIEETISNFLDELNIEYLIEENCIFDSCGYSCGYVSVAIIDENKKLDHIVFEWGKN